MCSWSLLSRTMGDLFDGTIVVQSSPSQYTSTVNHTLLTSSFTMISQIAKLVAMISLLVQPPHKMLHLPKPMSPNCRGRKNVWTSQYQINTLSSLLLNLCLISQWVAGPVCHLLMISIMGVEFS